MKIFEKTTNNYYHKLTFDYSKQRISLFPNITIIYDFYLGHSHYRLEQYGSCAYFVEEQWAKDHNVI